MGPPVDEFGLRDRKGDVERRGSPGDFQEKPLEASYVGPVSRRCHREGKIIHVRDHDARWDAEMKGGNVDEEKKGRQRGALRGSYLDRGRYVGGALEDECAPSSSEERGNPVDHVGGYVFGEEEGWELGRVDIVEAGFYVKEEGGDFQEGSSKGSDIMGEGGHCIRGAEAGEGATLVWVE